MFSRVKSFVRNHWKKVVIGGVTVKLISYGVRYAANQFLLHQETQAQEHWIKMKKLQHFESTEETFISTYLSLLPKLKETIVRNLDADSRTNLLKNKISNKLEVWNELKVIAFTRIIVTIYSTSLLNVLLRIQLNIIGGYLFLESDPRSQSRQHAWRNVNGIILSNVTDIDVDLQEKYLSLANYFVQHGLANLCDHIYEKTAAVVNNISLKQKLTISELEQIFWRIINEIKGPASSSLSSCIHPAQYPWKYTFPEDILEKFNYFQNPTSQYRPHYEPPDMYEHLMNETYDLLDSVDVHGILKAFESHGISHFLDRVSESLSSGSNPGENPMNISGTSTSSSSSMNNSTSERHIFNEASSPLAKIIPLMNSIADTCFIGSDPWIVLLATSDNVRVLGANVYESFSTTLSI